MVMVIKLAYVYAARKMEHKKQRTNEDTVYCVNYLVILVLKCYLKTGGEMCYLQLPPTQQLRSGSLQGPQMPSTSSSVMTPCTSSHLVGLTQSDPLKIIPRGHVPPGKIALLSYMMYILLPMVSFAVRFQTSHVQYKLVGKLFTYLEKM